MIFQRFEEYAFFFEMMAAVGKSFDEIRCFDKESRTHSLTFFQPLCASF